VTYLPSHAGEPGPQADPAHRDRWRQARRVVTALDTPALGEGTPARRLDRWVGDLVGPILEPRRDLSGGRWREVRGLDAPATPSLERHKFLYRTASGDWLAKFAGLGEGGATKARGPAAGGGGVFAAHRRAAARLSDRGLAGRGTSAWIPRATIADACSIG
jgi:hypothetical protein